MLCPICRGEKTTLALAYVKDANGVPRDRPIAVGCTFCHGMGELDSDRVEISCPAVSSKPKVQYVKRPWLRRY